jgi:hypothetical protein
MTRSTRRAAWCLLLAAGAASGADRPPARTVGQVVIVGNTDTADWIIRHLARIEPGDKVGAADLAAAAGRLRSSWIFRADPPGNPGPTVTFLPARGNADGTVDVLIQVEDRPWNGVAWGVFDLWIALKGYDPVGANEAALRIRDAIARRWGVVP